MCVCVCVCVCVYIHTFCIQPMTKYMVNLTEEKLTWT